MLYQHILVLFNDKHDGEPLLQHAATLASKYQAKLSLCHLLSNYRLEDYISDSLLDDDESRDVIAAKALLSHLVKTVAYPVTGCVMVADESPQQLEHCIEKEAVDLIVCGHTNRLLGRITSQAMRIINNTQVDVLIKHI